MEKFKYPEVLFTSEGRVQQEIDRHIGLDGVTVCCGEERGGCKFKSCQVTV